MEGLKIAIKLRELGIPIPIIDLLNGVISIEKKLILVSDDNHFQYFFNVEQNLKIISVDSFLNEIKKSIH